MRLSGVCVVMATYEVTCEFVVSRTVWVDARHGVEAKELAQAEISEREGIPSEEVFIMDAQREIYGGRTKDDK